MRIQHGHESQDLTKVYHGTSPRNPALEGTPGFKSQYPLHRKGERTWQNRLPIDEGIIMPVQGDTNRDMGSRYSVETGVET